MTSPRLRVPTPAIVATAGEDYKLPEPIPSTLETTRQSSKPKLLSLDELPEWYQDSQHIRYGYRPVSGSVITSFLSWGYIHNETINIFSHLIPALGFAIAEWYLLQYLHSQYARVNIADDFIFAFFLFTAAACLGLSSTYHTLINHSRALEALWLRLDFVGIVLLTIGDFVSGIYMSGMPYYLIEGGFLCLGVIVFVTRFPESISPGTFDIYGSSHQIFHVLVAMATVTQLVGILAAFDYNYHRRIC
ncbi:ADIPOR-like receptor IZH2 [Cytospora mali]|uniref:ADIPOR-like receptor IZH2 n=1 Tax=Cytospora mali TaxID=578113 RepID=A0A194VSA9_CYTMA|nr:ADIPOR-like receptor IZH2 [Valsa mali]